MLRNFAILTAFITYALAFPHLANFPEHRSLAGLSAEEIRAVSRQFSNMPGAQPLPPPINDTSSKLVNDADHPFIPAGPNDIRGPCPGLNTLASHGYIPRNGIVTPAQIITGIQEGFNMGYHFGSFLCYSGFITDGNHLTNMMTIGQNTTVDGAFVTGINTHSRFEGDVSITRQDAYFGNNFLFMEPEFDTLIRAANEVGGGVLTREAAAYDRALRANDSIARNPVLNYQSPRFLGATAESGFMLALFASGQTVDITKPVTLDEARHFFDFHRFPNGFFRRDGPYEFPKVIALTNELVDMAGIRPGVNNGAGNYMVNPTDPANFCFFYQKQVNITAALYPDPPADLRAAIKQNLLTYYSTLGDPTCEQYFPYGQ